MAGAAFRKKYPGFCHCFVSTSPKKSSFCARYLVLNADLDRKSSPPQDLFWPPFDARNMTHRSQKPGYGLLLGCRLALDPVPFFKKLRCSNKTNGKNRKKSSPSVRVPDRNRSGVNCRAWSNKSGRTACWLQKSRVAWQTFGRKNRKTLFWPEIFHCLEQDRLLFARVEIGVTKFSPKEMRNFGLIF